MAQIIKGGSVGPIGVEAHQRTNANLQASMSGLQQLGRDIQARKEARQDVATIPFEESLARFGGDEALMAQTQPDALYNYYETLFGPRKAANMVVDKANQRLSQEGLRAATALGILNDEVVQANPGIDNVLGIGNAIMPNAGPLARAMKRQGWESWGITGEGQTPSLPKTAEGGLAPGGAGISTPAQAYQAPAPAVPINPQTGLPYYEPQFDMGDGMNPAVMQGMGFGGNTYAEGKSSVPGMEAYDQATGGQDAHHMAAVGDGEGIINAEAMKMPGLAELVDHLNKIIPNPAAKVAPDSVPMMAGGQSPQIGPEVQSAPTIPAPPAFASPLQQGFPIMADGQSPQPQGESTASAPEVDPIKEEEKRIASIIKFQDMAQKTQDPQVQGMIMQNLQKLGWTPPPPPDSTGMNQAMQNMSPQQIQQMRMEMMKLNDGQQMNGGPGMGGAPVQAGGRVPVYAEPPQVGGQPVVDPRVAQANAERIGRLAETASRGNIEGMTTADQTEVIRHLYDAGEVALSRRLAAKAGLIHPDVQGQDTADPYADVAQQVMNPANLGKEEVIDGYQRIPASQLLGEEDQWDINPELSARLGGNIGGEQFVYAKPPVEQPDAISGAAPIYRADEDPAPTTATTGGGEDTGTRLTTEPATDNKERGNQVQEAAKATRWQGRNLRNFGGVNQSELSANYANMFYPDGMKMEDTASNADKAIEFTQNRDRLTEAKRQFDEQMVLDIDKHELDERVQQAIIDSKSAQDAWIKKYPADWEMIKRADERQYTMYTDALEEAGGDPAKAREIMSEQLRNNPGQMELFNHNNYMMAILNGDPTASMWKDGEGEEPGAVVNAWFTFRNSLNPDFNVEDRIDKYKANRPGEISRVTVPMSATATGSEEEYEEWLASF